MMAQKNWKKVGGVAGGLAAIGGALAVVWTVSANLAPVAPEYPKPQISGITKEWVLTKYIPFLAKQGEYRAATERGFREKALRTYWASAVEGILRAHNWSGKCPGSPGELTGSRLSPFIPIDRFPGTPLRGRFMRGGDLPLHRGPQARTEAAPDAASELPAVLHMDDAVDAEAAVRDNAEGTVLFKLVPGGAKAGIVYVTEFGGGPRARVWVVDCFDRGAGPSTPLAERARAWKGLADALNSYVLAFTVFTGRPPAFLSDLDGTVGIRNPAAWEDPEVGPVLQTLLQAILGVWGRLWTPREPLGAFEPVPDAS